MTDNHAEKIDPFILTPCEKAIQMLSIELGHPPFPPLITKVEILYEEIEGWKRKYNWLRQSHRELKKIYAIED